MEFKGVTFRSTLFPANPIQINEEWISKLNSLMSEFRLVPSVGTNYNIGFETADGIPAVHPFYFMEFKRLDNSFKVTFRPDRFDVEKTVSLFSMSSPVTDFLQNAEDVWKSINNLNIVFNRAALALIANIYLNPEEKNKLIDHFMGIDKCHILSELAQRMVYKCDYECGSSNKIVTANEVIEFGCDNVNDEKSFLKIGLDYNSCPESHSGLISKLYLPFLSNAALRMENVMSHDNLRKLLYI